jgi:uncharacterized protein (TIGR02231 family)
MLCLVSGFAAFGPRPAAAQTEVSSKVERVTVYPDGATVTRVIEADLSRGDSVLRAADFPPSLDPASLRVEGEAAARLTIAGIDARPPRADKPAAARRKFAERFADQSPVGVGEKGEARPLSDWRAAFAAVEDEIAAAEKAIGEARILQRDIDRKLARLDAQRTANPPRKMEVRIDVNAQAAAHAVLRVSYTVRGARWSPLYDARLDTGKDVGRGKDSNKDTGKDGRKPAVELVRRAEVVQTTGEDWQDVQLAVSTARTAKGGSAPELRPLIVRYPIPRRAFSQAPMSAAPAAPAGAASKAMMKERADGVDQEKYDKVAAEEQEATADSQGFQVVYHIPGHVSVSASEGAKNFRISSATITPDLLLLRAAPAVDATAFLEADFKHVEDAPLLPGPVAIYRDGTYVGRGQIAMTAKDENVRLGFGADDSVKIVRSTLRQLEGSAGILSTSKTERRDYKTSIRNGHDMPIRIIIEDQVPVSEIDEVKVEMLSVTTPPTEKDVRNRRGVMAWSLDLAPGAAKDLRIAWLVRWPSDKMVVYTPGQ